MKAAELIRQAYSAHYAVGQFNAYNMESVQAVARAAVAERSPALIGTSMGGLRHAGMSYLAALAKQAAAESSVPLLLHADHARDLDTIRACIAAGWASVMIDASEHSLQDNIALTREAVAMAHAAGVAVEAQLGETWDEETGAGQMRFTTPDMARDFVQATGIDYLAVSIGNTPGALQGEAHIDLTLLKAIAKAARVPLVLHGGSSVSEATVRTAIAEGGIAKVNVDTAIRRAFTLSWNLLYGRQDSPRPADPRMVMDQARADATYVIRQKMRLFGSSGKG